MPAILLAGVIAALPKIDLFPHGNGRPRAEMLVKVEGNDDFLYRIVAFNELIDVFENLQVGDALSAQGHLQVELSTAKKGQKATCVGFYIVADQVLPLRKRYGIVSGWSRGFRSRR